MSFPVEVAKTMAWTLPPVRKALLNFPVAFPNSWAFTIPVCPPNLMWVARSKCKCNYTPATFLQVLGTGSVLSRKPKRVCFETLSLMNSNGLQLYANIEYTKGIWVSEAGLHCIC